MAIYRDQVAFITGGAAGIGKALCEKLAASGASVIVADIRQEKAREVADAIVDRGGAAEAVKLDVSQQNEVTTEIEKVVERYGHLDYIFNNAGVTYIGETREMPEAMWKHVVGVNLFGVIHGTIAAYKVMAAQGSGHIVNMASEAGLIPLATSAAYATTKHAVVGLSLSLRPEAEQYGVKVSTVCPGRVKSDMLDTNPIAGITKEAYIELGGVKMWDASKAAEVILQGVEKNKPIIVFPSYCRILWLIHRYLPPLYAWMNKKAFLRYRSIKTS